MQIFNVFIHFFSAAQAYAYEYGEKYGSNSVGWIGPIPMFLTSDPQTVQDVLKSKNCIDKPTIIYNGFASVLGSGLVTLSGMDELFHIKITLPLEIILIFKF